MKREKASYILFILLMMGVPSFCPGQFYDTGQDPYSIDWVQINTPRYQIIFPSDFEEKGQELANIFELYYPHVSESLGEKPGKIPVIVHTKSVYSNGYVVWAPKRVEIWSLPPQGLYAQEWFEQLSIHEMRHVAQVDKMNKGLTKALYYLFGQQAVGAVVGYIPRWFLEGDAVAMETAFSRSGRGRIAEFEQEIRAQVMDREIYDYQKATLGSFKDHVPNHYQLGYPMVTYGREKFGKELWDKTLDHVAKNPYQLFPFYFGLKKYSGLSKRKLYRQTYQYLDSLWNIQDSKIKKTALTRLTVPPENTYTSYKFPRHLPDGRILAEKTGLSIIKTFVAIDSSGNEEILHQPGFYSSVKLSETNKIFVWTENISDPRWANRDYSVIKKHDIQTGQTVQLTRESRYFAPDLNKDGKKIVAVKISETNEYSLAVLDANNGRVMKSIPAYKNAFPQHPVWDEKDEIIYVTLLDREGKSIFQYDVKEGTWKRLYGPRFENITYLSPWKNYLFYSSPVSGIENIYALNVLNKEIYRVTNAKFGAFFPEPANDSVLYFSNYTSRGYEIASTSIKMGSLVNKGNVANYSPKLYKTLVEQEDTGILHEDIPDKKYTVKNYSRLGNLFNFHSWAPIYFDYEDIRFSDPKAFPGISLLSQNRLSTAFTTLGYAYKDGDNHLFSTFEYRGMYPVFRVSADYGGNPGVFQIDESKGHPVVASDNMNFRTRVSLPLNFINNKYIKGISPSVEWRFNNAYYFRPSINDYTRGMSYINYQMVAYRYLKTSHRDLAPRWGQVFTFRYSHTPFENELIGNIFSTRGTFYFPGFFKHNSFKLTAGFQKQNPIIWLYGSYLNFPRGYTNLRTEELYLLQTDYALPLWYPDWNISSMLYFKRLRANLFYDFARNENTLLNEERQLYRQIDYINTYGIELRVDYHVAQIFVPFTSGIRVGYKPGENNYLIDFLFSVDITDF
jgi:hypothetical protein